jgi:hypothetical protein
MKKKTMFDSGRQLGRAMLRWTLKKYPLKAATLVDQAIFNLTLELHWCWSNQFLAASHRCTLILGASTLTTTTEMGGLKRRLMRKVTPTPIAKHIT